MLIQESESPDRDEGVYCIRDTRNWQDHDVAHPMHPIQPIPTTPVPALPGLLNHDTNSLFDNDSLSDDVSEDSLDEESSSPTRMMMLKDNKDDASSICSEDWQDCIQRVPKVRIVN